MEKPSPGCSGSLDISMGLDETALGHYIFDPNRLEIRALTESRYQRGFHGPDSLTMTIG